MKTAYTPPLSIDLIRCLRTYELSNHVSNVLVAISDKRTGHDAGNGNYDYFEADVVTANDYYPFGMMMPGRKYSVSNSYRYGFNGKEQDPETLGQGNEYNYGFRIFNPRIGRFLSVDPLVKSFPWYTPYQFTGNKPINHIDLDGLEEYEVYHYEFTNSFGEKVVYSDKIKVMVENIKVAVENQRPEFGSIGTLTHYAIQDPNSPNWTYFDVYVVIREEKKTGIWNWFKGILGSVEKINSLQLVIFGDGHGGFDIGSKFDYSKPVETFNFAKFSEYIELAAQGMDDGIIDEPDGETFSEKLKDWSELYRKELEEKVNLKNYELYKNSKYVNPGNDLIPNEHYNITPDPWPMSDIDPSIGHTEVVTGPNGQVMDTIKQPSINDITRGKTKTDTIRNKYYKIQDNLGQHQ